MKTIFQEASHNHLPSCFQNSGVTGTPWLSRWGSDILQGDSACFPKKQLIHMQRRRKKRRRKSMKINISVCMRSLIYLILSMLPTICLPIWLNVIRSFHVNVLDFFPSLLKQHWICCWNLYALGFAAKICFLMDKSNSLTQNCSCLRWEPRKASKTNQPKLVNFESLLTIADFH